MWKAQFIVLDIGVHCGVTEKFWQIKRSIYLSGSSIVVHSIIHHTCFNELQNLEICISAIISFSIFLFSAVCILFNPRRWIKDDYLP